MAAANWAATKGATSLGAMPVNVSLSVQATVTAGLANEPELLKVHLPARPRALQPD